MTRKNINEEKRKEGNVADVADSNEVIEDKGLSKHSLSFRVFAVIVESIK